VTRPRVHQIIREQLADADQQRGLLTDEAFSIHQERLERLLAANWEAAMAGDLKASEFCRRLLEQQSKFYGLASVVGPAPGARTRDGADEQAPRDELARLRAQRAQES
jgi:hypothetical protein